MVKKISENEFNIIKNESAVLVDFSATWCGPCKMLAPVLEEVSEELKDSVNFYNIDIDENPDLAEQYQITSIPSLVLLKNGAVADMQIGFLPKAGIIEFINSKL